MSENQQQSHRGFESGVFTRLHPALRQWFHNRFPKGPTRSQLLLWPSLLDQKDAVLSAPTGTGKTLAAMVPIYQNLLTTEVSSGISSLYLCPLRALAKDVSVRVAANLEELKVVSQRELTVALRTGDTPQHQRKKLHTDPPQILVTTPESLSLLLVSDQAQSLFQSLQQIVVDEVHSLAGTKRGAQLAIDMERLNHLTRRPPQRIGLSATCHPLSEVAQWLVGTDRPVAIHHEPDTRPWKLHIEYMPEANRQGRYLSELLTHLIPIIEANQTILLFTNLRSTAERITWLLRRKMPVLADRIGIHHGSLAGNIREEVERKLREHELRAVITSTSLELGVDIGGVDHVILIQLPGGANRLMQRLGRSSHQPDGLRQGTLFTTTIDELHEAFVTKSNGGDALLEQIRITSKPFDVLCQQMIAMALKERPSVPQLYALVRRAYPYRALSLADYVRCLEFLTGGKAKKELPRRLAIRDGILIPADKRLKRIYRTNLGTIPEEGQRVVRRSDDDQPLGAVTENFADNLKPGDRFLLEGKVLEIVRHEMEGIAVAEETGMPAYPHWQGGMWPLPHSLAERIWHTRCLLKEQLLDGEAAFLRCLRNEYQLTDEQSLAILDHYQAQEAISEIPTQGLYVEAWGSDTGESIQYALHLPMAPAGAEGLARVIATRLHLGSRSTILPGMLGVLLTLPSEVELTPQRLRDLLSASHFETDLDRSLQQTIPLARRFQQCAYNGLMLLRRPLSGKRRVVGGKYWAGMKMLNWFRFTWPDFCLFQQAHEEVRNEIYQADAVARWLRLLPRLPITMRHLSAASPFASCWMPAPVVVAEAPKPITEVLTNLLENTHG